MKRSISFGLNRVSPENYGGWPGYLIACCKDATDMAGTLVNAGFEAAGYFDEQCTTERLRSEIQSASAELNSGDYFLFSNSGHGSQPESWTGKTEALCMFDGLVFDKELRLWLSEFKAGVNVILIFDTCHAGGMDRAFNPSRRPRVAPLFVTHQKQQPHVNDVALSANVILLAGSGADELSLDGLVNGVFTDGLLRTLKQEPGTTWRQWLDACARLLSMESQAQHPRLIQLSDSSLQDMPITRG